MMVAGGATVRVGGFRRGPAPDRIEGIAPVDLGTTGDMKMLQRVKAIAANLARPERARSVTAGADIIVARNLESLAIAAAVRRPEQKLVYECLDIHHLLLGTGPAARLVQRVHARLLRGVDLIITSSPAFIEQYFRPLAGFTGPILLVENKVWGVSPPALPHPRREPPWRIAWLGMLRCRKSATLLRDIAAAANGAIEVTIAGRVAYASIPDFDAIVASSPHLRFVGPYTPDDLPRLYADADFAWVVDFYEEGQNSAWLLPNRLYESMAFGCVPIAQQSVEIGRALAGLGVGLTFDDLASQVAPRLTATTTADYGRLADAVDAILRNRLFTTVEECTAMVQAMAGQ
jgi:succinoglycan biosynthesis protein ExoL